MGPSWKKLGRKLSVMDVRKGATDESAQSRFFADPIPEEEGFPSVSEQRPTTTIQDLERTILEQRRIIERLEEEDQIQKAQNWSIVDQFNNAKAQLDQSRIQATAQEERIRNLNWQVQAESARVGSLKAACEEKEQELSARSNSIKVLSDHNQQLQTRVNGLENILTMASGKTGHNLKIYFNHQTELETAHREATENLKASQESQSHLQQALQLSESEVATLRTVLDELQKEISGYEICQPTTLRSLLTIRSAEPAPIPPGNVEVPQTWVPSGLSQSQLDKTCTSEEIQALAKLLPKGWAFNNFYERLRFDACSVCSKSKFNFRLDGHPRLQSLKWLNEYLGTSRYFTCCQEKVCKECFKKHLLETLESKWWNRLGTLQWFMCPRTGCDQALEIRYEADLQICLERILGIPADEHIKMYVKALAFRKALNSLNPVPDEEALKKAAKLTQALVVANLMYSPFDTRFDPSLVDETGCIPDFQPGTIFSAAMDNSTSRVPLFPKFFRRQARPKECMACSKSMFEIDYGSVEAWKRACKGFEGSWMWSLLLFPTSEIQQCGHDFEVCRACTAEHIRNTLVSGGPSACGNLTCPQCNRKLQHQEILLLTDAKTVAKYEKFLLQSFLSQQPNFRGCLNPICTNGELYDNSPSRPKISCGECRFEMCFTHSMPWHNGLTCAQYDSQRQHGDPGYAETQTWIRTMTKPCPNASCSTPIQKGEACFHMTCSQCQHEFCWQCLATWSDIRARGQSGHAADCFFRTNNVSPQGVRGENLAAALGSRARRP